MIFMMLGGLLFWACLASLLPVLPAYVKDAGASDHEVGIVMRGFAIGLLLFRPKMGQLIDTRGRKAALLIGIVVAAIAPLLYALTTSTGMLLAIRIFHGLSIAAFTTSYSTLVADLAPAENRGELIGYMSLVNPIGMAIGPALGGYLHPLIGNQALFFVCSGLGVGSFLFSLMVQSTPVIAPPDTADNRPKLTAWHIVSHDRFRIPTFTMLSVGLAFGVLSVYLPLFVKQENFAMNVGLFYTMAAIASFMTRLVSGKASDKVGRGLFITVGLLCYMVSMIMLWAAQDVPTILAAGFIEGCGGGMLLPIMIALITDRCLAHERGRVYSLCIGGFDLGIFMAGPLVGFMAAWVGYRGLFAIAALVTLLATIVFITLSSKNLAYSLRFSLGKGRDLYALPKT
ncbi:MFS transporter [filamentous cyanobacterium LEGE 11480]|uniref:MFS transporter n=2 Tax=Romeriopsis TaxID=2992131 RepID=A0A928VRJ1_9CYAN|nr:MFS transporter [Romeriopsis navalis LEGE 11480]